MRFDFHRTLRKLREPLPSLSFICLIATVAGCKVSNTEITNSRGTNTPYQTEQGNQPSSFVNHANDQELREQFLALVSKYKAAPKSAFELTASATSLTRPRRAQALNIKMSAPIAMIVKTAGKQGAVDQGAPIRAAAGRIRKQFSSSNIVNVIFPDADDERHMAAVVDFLSSDARIAAVEPDYLVRAVDMPNDPRFKELWGLKNANGDIDANALNAWSTTTGSRSVVVGVIDTGIDCTHPDLQANCWINPGESGNDSSGKDKRTNGRDDDGNGYIDDWQGWNFLSESNTPFDDNKHGTHVAGTIGAVGNNGIGVTGINWQVSLVPLKFLAADGSGYNSDAIEAIDYATKMKFFAVNNSWGGGPYSALLDQAIQRANAANMHFVAAAGNNGTDNDLQPMYPANYNSPNVIAVAAMNSLGELTSFSCYGKTTVDLAAPGDSILSTIPGGNYASFRGTSMASPHVTGALALLKSQYPDESAAALRNRIFRTVKSLPRAIDVAKIRTGGMLDIAGAMQAKPDTNPPPPPLGELIVKDQDLAKSTDAKQKYLATVAATLRFQRAASNGETTEASSYEFRISTVKIENDETWSRATPLSINTIQKNLPDNWIEARVSGIPVEFDGWIAVKVFDASENYSPVSAPAKITTIKFTPKTTYDAVLPQGSAFDKWVIEDDANRGKVFSDSIGSYPDNSSSRMTLREFRIPDGFQRMILRYWTSYSIDPMGEYFGSPQDFGRVYVAGEAGYNTLIDEVTGRKDWHQRTIDITDMARDLRDRGKKSIQIYFELTSDAWSSGPGWLVDDIELAVQDSLITVSGLPTEVSAAPQLNLQVHGPPGTVYSSQQSVDGLSPCPSGRNDSTIPKTPITSPMVLDQSSAPFGQAWLYVKAIVPGITNPIFACYNWIHENKNAVVDASGFPTLINNQKSFVLNVKPMGGAQPQSYMYGLAASPLGATAQDVCRNNLITKYWSDWIPISQPATVSIPEELKNTSGQVVLCLYGKDSMSSQMLPTAYSWAVDFVSPTITATSEPPPMNTLSDVSVAIKGNDEPLGSCKAKLISGSISSCPPVSEGYVDCSSQPDRHSVKLLNDGSYALCIWGFDKVGNVSKNSSKTSWTRDTVAMPLVFTGTPLKVSNEKYLTVAVNAGEAGTYQYVLVQGNTCDIAKLNAAAPRFMEQSISETLPSSDGPFTLCGRFTDTLGNRQRPPTSYSWTKRTAPPTATVSAGVPLSPSPAAALSIEITGTNVVSYQFAVVKSIDSDCRTGLNFGPWTDVGTKAKWSINPPTDGFMTFCLVGKDEAGNIQTMPTVHRWLRLGSSPVVTTTGTFASITKGAKGKTTQTLLFKRTGTTLPKETITARVCPVNVRTGALGRCISQSGTFAQGSADGTATFTGLTAGKWVGVLLPKDGSRGRAEPLLFDF